MALLDYRKASFSQGHALAHDYALRTEITGGICFALMIQWFKALKNPSSATATDRMTALSGLFSVAAGRQMIMQSGWGVEGKTCSEMELLFTALGRQFGYRFAYEQGGSTGADIGNCVSAIAPDTRVYLHLTFRHGNDATGAHAIGILTGARNLCFDPNLGEFEFSPAQAGSFFGDLWADYLAVPNVNAIDGDLFLVTEQQTVMQMWRARAAAHA